MIFGLVFKLVTLIVIGLLISAVIVFYITLFVRAVIYFRRNPDEFAMIAGSVKRRFFK